MIPHRQPRPLGGRPRRVVLREVDAAQPVRGFGDDRPRRRAVRLRRYRPRHPLAARFSDVGADAGVRDRGRSQRHRADRAPRTRRPGAVLPATRRVPHRHACRGVYLHAPDARLQRGEPYGARCASLPRARLRAARRRRPRRNVHPWFGRGRIAVRVRQREMGPRDARRAVRHRRNRRYQRRVPPVRRGRRLPRPLMLVGRRVVVEAGGRRGASRLLAARTRRLLAGAPLRRLGAHRPPRGDHPRQLARGQRLLCVGGTPSADRGGVGTRGLRRRERRPQAALPLGRRASVPRAREP